MFVVVAVAAVNFQSFWRHNIINNHRNCNMLTVLGLYNVSIFSPRVVGSRPRRIASRAVLVTQMQWWTCESEGLSLIHI